MLLDKKLAFKISGRGNNKRVGKPISLAHPHHAMLLRSCGVGIREFKIYDAAGSTTRSEFQLKNER